MPISLPNLDDRTYADLMEEARGMIPAQAPEWTNHNASDPGITLLELFAYLTEMLIYRLNRVTDANVYAFLKLIDGKQRAPSNKIALAEDVRNVVLELRRINRAVTCEDYEQLVLAAFGDQVERAFCLPLRNVESDDLALRIKDRPGHVSVIIVPRTGLQPSEKLIGEIKEYLEPRRLLTTRIHVAGPHYVNIGVRIKLFLKPDALEDDVRKMAVKALQGFLHPLTGGRDKKGWPFGRSVYISEIYELLDLLPGVDFVTKDVDRNTLLPLDELVVSDASRLRRKSPEELIAVELHPGELVQPIIDEKGISIVSPLKSLE
ncbi:MAG TPA: baseplate J/gp47 family protein [Blastocatellia bacterium]|nr:baseplate J/gp47 family protein [Blastocatellia bacterium]